MRKRTYISTECMHPKAPVHAAIVWWLLLDRFGAPGWAFGVLWTAVAILAIGFIADMVSGESKEVPGFGERML